VKLKLTEDGVGWSHRYLEQQQQHVLTIVEARCFNLKQIRWMRYEELALVDLGLELSSMEQVLQPGSVEKVN
jgi:hypothetical protein